MSGVDRTNLKKDIFPVALLTEGRRCVVVGGGRIGVRKVNLLLEAGAEVVVVSPELCDELNQLAGADIEHVARPFQDDDVDGAFLVFAATSDKQVNQHVLQVCNERGVYACSIDKTWSMGDFVTPATVRKNGITVSVSTGGKSCRRAKMIKESFERHLQMVDSADLIVVGTSHNYLAIREREKYHLVGKRMEEIGDMLMQIWGVHEFALLNTCNRVELHAIASEKTQVEKILRHVLGFTSLDQDGYYVKRGYEAFAHVNVLTAGLLSQTPGEKHIVAQMKNAVADARERGWAGAMMQQWLDAALHISKDIRGETHEILHHSEIEDLCQLYLDSECDAWKESPVLVMGTGVIGACVCEQLAKKGVQVVWCYHRNKPEVPAKYQHLIALCSMNGLREKLGVVGVVICATGAEKHVLHTGHAPFFDQESETVVIDLAMPRNVAPELDENGDAIRLLDLDDLKHWYRREIADMAKIFEISHNTIEQHKGMYDKLINTFQGGNAG